jgi:hypothetical protein
MYFRLGPHRDPIVDDEIEQLRVRFPDRDPTHAIVTGGASELMARLGQYVDVGVTKFVLRPVARGDDDFIDQTRKFIDTIIPEIAALNARNRALGIH